MVVRNPCTIQWNLRTRDILGATVLSLVERGCPYLGGSLIGGSTVLASTGKIKKILYACVCVWSLKDTPEMRTPLYIKDTFFCLNGVHIRGIPLYMCVFLVTISTPEMRTPL